MFRATLASLCFLHLASASSAAPRTIEVSTHRMDKEPFSEKLVEKLKVPSGFEVTVVAKDLEGARMLAVAPEGVIYVTRPSKGDVRMLRDGNGDGKADSQEAALTGLDGVHGIALRGDDVFLATPKELYRTTREEGGKLSKPEVVLKGLPDGAQHPNRTMAFAPDGSFYLSIGSSCNACDETNPEHATMLKVDLEKKTRTVFARGLRNTIGFDWHPETREFWGMDHGADMLGDDVPPEELNQLVEGKDYGWPWAYGNREMDPNIDEPKEGPSKAERAQSSAPMVLGYQAHSAPIAMVFYDGQQFPNAYRGDAFVAFHGSWNRRKPVGYHVARLRFEAGKPRSFDVFLEGFLLEGGERQFGRPAGLAVDRDGSLLVSDDANGVVYRVRHSK